MKIFIYCVDNEYLETISLEDFDNLEKTLKKLSSIKEPLEANILAVNESVSSHKLAKIKNCIDNVSICSLRLYSNNRDTILAGKFLKIDSTFVKEEQIKKKLLLHDLQNKNDILHKGTVRSGNRISSNGNLCIIGDVNPGAIISAKRNIYVWGKLLGIAFAGKDGDNNASITSLYLNPLQLRIADVIAIGPKDKPRNYYPEIAVIDKQTINIKPYLIEVKK